MILSTNARARLGSPFLHFRDQDAVLYDQANDTAAIFFHGDNFRRSNGLPGANEDLKAVHYVILGVNAPQQDPVVPEPLTAALSLLGLAALGTTLKRRR